MNFTFKPDVILWVSSHRKGIVSFLSHFNSWKHP